MKEKVRGPLTPERQAMVMQWMPLYHRTVGEYRIPRDHDGQVIRDKMLAVLVKICHDFDPAVWHNPYSVIYKSLSRVASREKKALWRRRLRGKLVQMTDDRMALSVEKACDTDFTDRCATADIAETVRAAVAALPREGWKVRVRLYYGIDVPARLNTEQIGKLQGVSRRAVWVSLTKAIRFMRKWMKENAE